MNNSTKKLEICKGLNPDALAENWREGRCVGFRNGDSTLRSHNSNKACRSRCALIGQQFINLLPLFILVMLLLLFLSLATIITGIRPEPFRLLVHGTEGVGKTFFASKAPDHSSRRGIRRSNRGYRFHRGTSNCESSRVRAKRYGIDVLAKLTPFKIRFTVYPPSEQERIIEERNKDRERRAILAGSYRNFKF